MKFQVPRGTRDFLPEEMAKRRIVFDRIRSIFDRYGYGEVCTPAFEDFELLSKKSGPDIENELYVFKDKSGRKLGLRFDPTVPICRIVSNDPSMINPIKFSYITNMWRYDRPGAGRWREFWQAGVELIGSSKPEADVEIIQVVYDILTSLGIKDFYFKINSRVVIEDFIKESGISEKKKFDVFRAIDKLGKIGEKGVRKEMERYEIDKKKIDKFISLVREKGNTKELLDIIGLCKLTGIENIEIDFSIVRGIDYYTGFVFETFVKGKESVGSVASGGRYDSLIGLYSGKETPATGFGLGIDRLLDAVKIKVDDNKKSVFIAYIKEKQAAMELAGELRKLGINVETDVMDRNLKKQLNYANNKKISYVIVLGEKEISSKKGKLKDMATGKEYSIDLENLEKIKELI
ncbi:histidine--tRNA ligase [Candidatus Aenigmatarchaeota archaeon]